MVNFYLKYTGKYNRIKEDMYRTLDMGKHKEEQENDFMVRSQALVRRARLSKARTTVRGANHPNDRHAWPTSIFTPPCSSPDERAVSLAMENSVGTTSAGNSFVR